MKISRCKRWIAKRMSRIQPTSSSNGDYIAIVRDMIKHENELMNHRITWLSTLHGLLFAALGFAWDKSDAQMLVVIFSVLGIIISISSITVLRAASGAINELAEWWTKNKPENYQGPDVIGRRTTKPWKRFLYPWNSLPVLFILAWLLVLGVNCARKPMPNNCINSGCRLCCDSLAASYASRKVSEHYDGCVASYATVKVGAPAFWQPNIHPSLIC